MPLESLRHVGLRDKACILLKGLGDGFSDKSRLKRVLLDIAPRDQLSYDIVARGFCSQTEFLHLLNEFTLGVSRRRQRLLVLKNDFVYRQSVADRHLGQDLILCLAVSVDMAVTLNLKALTRGGIFLAAGVKHNLKRLPSRIG